MTKNLNKAVEMALFDLAVGCKTSETKTIAKNGEVVEQIIIEKKQRLILKP